MEKSGIDFVYMSASEDSHNGACVGVVGGPAIATAFDSSFVDDETCGSHITERISSNEASVKSKMGEPQPTETLVKLFCALRPHRSLRHATTKEKKKGDIFLRKL